MNCCVDLWLLAIVLYLGLLIYNYATLRVFTLASFVLLVFILFLSPFSSVSKIIFSTVFIILFLFNFSFFTQRWISSRLLLFYRRIMPSLSATEREAIGTGEAHWAGEIFSGSPNWQAMLDARGFILSPEEEAFLNGPVEELCYLINDWDITHNRADMPEEVWAFLKKHKFFAMIIPKQYGGLEFSAAAHAAVITKVGPLSSTVGTTIAVPNSLGPAELILHYGTNDQKNYYLPRLASADEIPCFALTGPEAGSDATAMPDMGIVCKGNFQDKEIIGIKLNFNKRYITLAPIATVIGLAFKLYDPEHLIDKKENIGITLALIPRNTPGITIGRRHFPLNSVFQNGPIQGKDVFIPLEWIIGGEKMAGQGWRMLVDCLSVGRGITLPSLSAGGAKAAVAATGAYARIRDQFGVPIGKLEAVEEVLARMACFTYMIDAIRTMTVAAIDRGEKPAILTAISKYHATTLGRQVTNDAMDIHGGKGICLGPRNYLGRGYEASPISITVEGANILTRGMIIFGQGAIRCHPYVLKELNAALEKDNEKGLEKFDKAIFAHLGFILSNILRTFILALTSSKLVFTPRSSMKRYYQHFTRFSTVLALLTDFSMLIMGGGLKRREKISARLGDILSFIYIGSAILRRFHDDGEPAEDRPIVKWCCQYLLSQLAEQVDAILRNFSGRYSHRLLAGILNFLIFPLGKHFYKPSDRLGHQVAELILEPSETRTRFLKDLCVSEEANFSLGQLEKTLLQVCATAPLHKKILHAARAHEIKGHNYLELIASAIKVQLITDEEANALIDTYHQRMQVIAVDDFSDDELRRI